ncbi:MMPL family transporter [Paenibacillus psychroresistens]|uniref:MMPL family transporter n=1 Tax=Paenibacillus psychroresistens TaxID=1778678 RepID=A0A6B8RU92_9BACL|nr:MMPL family transporter [Paenibacillus psychroresistens]QGQ99507.1 MMPL family transporter [Paenibacillus psychroresistens]
MQKSWSNQMAGWVAGKRSKWVTLAIWIVLVSALTAIWPSVNSVEDNSAANLKDSRPSVQADLVAEREFPSGVSIPALVVWQRIGGLSDADYAFIQNLSQSLESKPLPDQTSIVPLHKLPLAALKAQASENGSTLIMPILFKADSDRLETSVDQLKDQVKTELKTDPFDIPSSNKSELSAHVTGPVGIAIDATGLFASADIKLLLGTVLVVLILLLLLYRSPVLAIIPLIGVGFAYGVLNPILGILGQKGWITADSQGISIMTVLLFGAGTDYCLFLIARFRKNLAEERDKTTALVDAIKASSGAIAMSGLTVVISLLALLLSQYGSTYRFAIPFSLSIVVMSIASLTLVPALLAIIGRASFFPFIPRTAEMRHERAVRKGKPVKPVKEMDRLGGILGRLVIRRPLVIVIITVILLGGFAAFASQIKLTFDILSSFPKNMESRVGFDIIGEQFSPGGLAPVRIIVNEEGKAANIASDLAKLSYVDKVMEPVSGQQDPNIKAYDVELSMNPYSMEAMDRIPDLREAAEQSLSNAGISSAKDKVWMQGETSTQYDTRVVTTRDRNIIIPVVIVLIALLLLLYLRSIVAMVYLVGTVILSYFSALGLGWLIVHYMFGAEAIQWAIPLYTFVFLVALGEDYNIFMISSIWQKRKIMPLRQAIQEGVAETSSVITSAGLILAGTFAVLATLPIQVLLQFGLITAIGVLLDTFIVRPFLVPAITVLLGRHAFWPGDPGDNGKAQQLTKGS